MKIRYLIAACFMTLGLVGAVSGSETCPDSKIMSGGMFSSLCWNCFFPMEIAGVSTGDEKNLPDDRYRSSVCTCPGRFGYPTEGSTMGMWQPTYLVETTRGESCSPVMNGTNLLGEDSAQEHAGGYQEGVGGTSFYHTNLWVFPVGMVTQNLPQSVCTKQSSNSFGLKYMSAIDPTWSNDELSMMLTPDANLFTTLVADAACMADSVASTVYKPIIPLYYCAGSWGRMLPSTGAAGAHSANADEYSLAAARTLAHSHRLGTLKMTYGIGICMDMPAPIMSKQQYRFAQMYPVAEVESNRWIGSNTTVTRVEPRNIPKTGEDFVQNVWVFNQCCANF